MIEQHQHMPALSRPLRLRGTVQHYAWGRPARDSVIAELTGVTDERCAELWMGAHPSGAAEVLLGEPLGRTSPLPLRLDGLLSDCADEILGPELRGRYGTLPFLFKVLSIASPLSIQAHPDRALAAALHRRDPQHYPDANHKPEMAVALSAVEMLYGFRPVEELREMLERNRAVQTLLGGERLTALLARGVDERAFLSRLYHEILEAPPDRLQAATGVLRAEQDAAHPPSECVERRWVRTLLPHYPSGDVGLFSFFVLQCHRLEPGSAVFIGPNIPHAYLSGELIECMANSDNVVRCGLTPKFRDTATLAEMLEFRAIPLTTLAPSELAPGVHAFRPPADEFGLVMMRPMRAARVQLRGPVITLTLAGRSTIRWGEGEQPTAKGDVWLVPNCLKDVEFLADDGFYALAGGPDFWLI